MPYDRKIGFTLIEILVVIIIIGILAAIALPGYQRTKERTLAKEAMANLKLIAAAERIYKMEANMYLYNNSLQALNDNLKLSLTAKNWNYAVANVANFTVTATRNDTSGCAYNLTCADYINDANPTANANCQ